MLLLLMMVSPDSRCVAIASIVFSASITSSGWMHVDKERDSIVRIFGGLGEGEREEDGEVIVGEGEVVVGEEGIGGEVERVRRRERVVACGRWRVKGGWGGRGCGGGGVEGWVSAVE